MEIIPAIDIIEGRCVRLTQGEYASVKVYNEHPLEVAKQFEDAGLSRLHLVDLDGAKAGAVKNWKVLERLASGTSLTIDFGGGIKTEKDAEIVLNSGADVFCTDVSKDGLLQGPSVPLYKNIIAEFPDLYFIASGGVSSIKDLETLAGIGCKGAIVGKAIYEHKITLEELKRFSASK